MNDASRILMAAQQGDPQAARQLLPLVYAELRQLAAQKLATEPPGQTIDATSLVHEAYLRMIGNNPEQPWHGRRHFFAAAAEAMRRILIDKARRKRRLRHGGEKKRVALHDEPIASEVDDRLLAVHEALEQLSEEDEQVTELVKLRYFVGLTIEEAAEVLGISVRTANRHWAYARAWLFQHLSD